MDTKSEDPKKIWILAGVGLIFSITLAIVLLQVDKGNYYDDFYTRWYATKQLFISGRSLYDRQNAIDATQWVVHPANDLVFYYPAYLLVFTGPLSLFPYTIARAIWTVLGMWGIWVGTYLFVKLPRQSLSSNQLTILLVGATTTFPFLQHTVFSQFNAIGVISLGLIYWALLRKKYFGAGLLTAGFLFKPQATLIPMIFILLWGLWKRERWKLIVGFLVSSLSLLAFAELMEPNWLSHFLAALDSYPAISSPAMDFGDQNGWLSGALVLLTLWFSWQGKETEPNHWLFRAGLLWALSLNALIVPLVATFHMVYLAPMLALMLGLVKERSPHKFKLAWIFTLLIFVIGLVGLSFPVLLFGVSDSQIITSEFIYRTLAPIPIAGIALWYLSTQKRGKQIDDLN